ncbi:hypothetical protein GCM10022222_34320 [Amycolatopsis ultiminotia]|uniref:Erythromycin biosynthesis protein CIII-like C-terminal domain-containing protein n=1 Tax=Amycolatopsis ultiminotia TaxID=543629 RepID=A0ABP6WB10_9PSEU
MPAGAAGPGLDRSGHGPAPVRRIRDKALELPRFAEGTSPTVLLTLGTVFSGERALAEFSSAVADAGVNVVATLGSALVRPPTTRHRDNLQHIPFAPLDQLLDHVDPVVAAGGSGTMLGAPSRGVPMVLCPQGADQPSNAALAKAAGVAIVVDSPAELTDAVAWALQDQVMRARVARVAAEIADAPTAS